MIKINVFYLQAFSQEPSQSGGTRPVQRVQHAGVASPPVRGTQRGHGGDAGGERGVEQARARDQVTHHNGRGKTTRILFGRGSTGCGKNELIGWSCQALIFLIFFKYLSLIKIFGRVYISLVQRRVSIVSIEWARTAG